MRYVIGPLPASRAMTLGTKTILAEVKIPNSST
jgi:hypothetical protein